jgi:hypothetical protein
VISDSRPEAYIHFTPPDPLHGGLRFGSLMLTDRMPAYFEMAREIKELGTHERLSLFKNNYGVTFILNADKNVAYFAKDTNDKTIIGKVFMAPSDNMFLNELIGTFQFVTAS